MNAFLEMALSNAVMASLMALAVFGLSRFCRRPALIHSLWILVLVKLITPPLLPIPITVSWLDRPAETPGARPERPQHPDRGLRPAAGRGQFLPPARFSHFEPTAAGAPHETATLTLKETLLTPNGVTSFKFDQQPESIDDETANMVEESTSANVVAATDEHQADLAELIEAPIVAGTRSAPAAAGADVADPSLRDSRVVDRPDVDRRDSAATWFTIQWRRVAAVLVGIWLSGSVVLLFWYCLRIAWFRKALRLAVRASDEMQREADQLACRLGIPQPPAVWLVPGVVAPMLWGGSRKPQLLFPRELLGRLNGDARRTLILHELAHLRRGDHWVRFLELIATTFYWWLPVVWWVRRQVHIAEEECCDACVVTFDPENGGVYATALLDTLDFLAETRPALPPATSGIGRVEFLKRRLTLIMQGTVSGRLSGFARIILLFLAAVALPMWPTLAAGDPEAETVEAPLDADDIAAAKQGKATPASKEQNPEPNALGEPLEFETSSRPLQFDPQEVRSVDISRDGKWMATGHGRSNTQGAVRLWNAKTGQELATFPSEKGIASVKFSPEGTLLASSGWDDVIRIRDVKTRKVVAAIRSFASVSRLAFSPDGKTLASVSEGQKFRLWNPRTGKEVARFDGDPFRMQQVAFSPDGKLIAVVGGRPANPPGGIVAVYDVASRKQIRIFKDHSRPVLAVAFSPNGKSLATAGADSTIRLRRWNNSILQARSTTLSGHRGAIETLAFAPDGRTLVSAGNDNQLRLWGAEAGESIAALAGPRGGILAVAFTPDGGRLLSGGGDKVVTVWNPRTRQRVRTLQPGATSLEVPQAILAVAWSPDAKTVASAHEDRTVRLRESNSGNVRTVLEGHDDVVTSIAFSPRGNIIATGSSDRTIKLWNAADGTLLHTLRGHTNWVYAVAFSPDGRTLASGGYDKSVRLWDPANGKETGRLTGHTATVRSVAFSPDGRRIVSGSGDRTLKLWNVADRKELATLKGHKGSIRAVVFSPDGKTIASGSEDRTIKLWDASTHKELRELTGHTGMVWCLAYSAHGHTLASGSFDNSIRLWDPQSGRSRQRLRGHGDVVTSLAFAPDMRGLVSGSYDRSLRFWKAKRPPISEIVTLAVSPDGTRSVAFAPNGRWMVTGAHDRLAKIWDLASGKIVKVLRGHSGGIRSVAISPDGRKIATGSWDNSILLWEAATGQILASFVDGQHSPVQVLFTPDGGKLISAGRDKTAKIWDLKTKKLVATTAPQSLPLSGLDVAPDGKTFVTSAGDYKRSNVRGTVVLWRVENGKEVGRFEGHSRCVNCVRFSPDGTRLVSNGYSGTRLWNAATRRLIRTIGPAAPVSCICFLADQKTVALGRYRGLSTWDTTTGREVAQYTAHSGVTHDLELSPDGSLFATAAQDGTVKFWPTAPPVRTQLRAFNAAGAWVAGVTFTPGGSHVLTTRGPRNSFQLWRTPRGELVRTFEGHTKPVFSVAVSPDGKRVLSGSEDRTARVWDLETGRLHKRLLGHTNTVRSVAFSPDGKLGLTAGTDRTVRLWDLSSGRELHRYKTRGIVCNAEFSPDGKRAVFPDGRTCAVWDFRSEKVVTRFRRHGRQVVCSAVAPDGKTVVSGDYGGTLILWDLNSGRELKRLIGHTDRIRAVTFSHDGRVIASGSYDKSIILWDHASGRLKKRLGKHGSMVLKLAFSPDDRLLISGGGDRRARLWDVGVRTAESNLAARVRHWTTLRPLPTLTAVRTTRGRERLIYSASASKDFRTLAVVSTNNTVKLIETATGKIRRTLVGHSKSVWSTAFAPDGKTVVTASDDGTAKVWNAETGALRTTLTGHPDRLVAVKYTPDGKTLATADRAGNIKLWDGTTYKELANLNRGTESLVCLAVSPDGKLLAAGGWKKEIALWDLTTRRLVKTLSGHKDRILSMSFAPDGRTLLSGDASMNSKEAIKIWDVPSGRLRLNANVLSSHVSATAFSPDGSLFVTSGSNPNLILWDARTGQQLRVIPSGHAIDVRSLLWSPDGKQLVSTDLRGGIRLWKLGMTEPAWVAGYTTDPKQDLAISLKQTLVSHGSQARFATFSADGRLLATGGQDQVARIWDVSTLRQKHVLKGHRSIVAFGAFSPDARLFVTGGNDNTVRLWNTATGKQLLVLEGHTDAVRKVAFTPDAKRLISSGDDGTVRVWNVKDGSPVRRFDVGLHVYAFAISSDGKRLATGSANWQTKEYRQVSLWDFATGRKLKDLKGSNGKVQSLEFLPGNRRLIAAGAGRVGTSIWDVETGRRLQTLQLRADVRLARLQKGGDLLATAHVNPGRVSLWSIGTGKLLAVADIDSYDVYTAEITPDGGMLVTADKNGTVKLWNVSRARRNRARPNATSSTPVAAP